MQTEFRNVELVRIIPDPNQPRKFFDEVALKELTDSVREKGVIQPIVVRPTTNGGIYMLVSGERRFRAAIAVQATDESKSTIPAVVRELTDREALELQIIENLQRKEVHPMEEAVAFRSLHSILNTAEIAQKVGKSESYVLKRMKLTELIDRAQQFLFEGKIEYSEALRLSRLDSQSQDEVLEVAIDQHYGRLPYKLEKYFGRRESNLEYANFKIDDPELYPEAGSCGSCQFNSAFNPMLFDDVNGQICNKKSCFEVKTARHREKMILASKSDPEITLVIGSVYSKEERKKEKELLDSSTVFLTTDQYESIDEEDFEVLSYENWLESEIGEIETPEEEVQAKMDYEEYKLEAESNKKKFEEKLAKGVIRKAFVVLGYGMDKTIFIEVKKDDLVSEEEKPDSVLLEIEELKKKELRAKELDAEKVWAQVRELAHANSNDRLVYSGENLKSIERTALGYAMLQEVGSLRPERFMGAKFKPGFFLSEADLNEISKYFIRYKLFGNWGSHKSDTGHRLGYMVLNEYFKDLIDSIEEKQKEKAENRIFRMSQKIADLKKPKPEPSRQMEIQDEIAETKSENSEPVQDTNTGPDPEPTEKPKKAKAKKSKELEPV